MTYFRKRRAIAGGLAIAGSSLGGVIFPIMVAHLLPKVGFAWTMRICAFLILGLLIITNLTVSSYLKHAPQPFKLSLYLKPLRETNFLIICITSFFLYCKTLTPSPSVPFSEAKFAQRGNVRASQLYRHLRHP